MNKKPLFWCLILLLVATYSVSAQKFSVKTHIDSTSMWIGNQTKLSFQVTQPKSSKVTFPLLSDSLKGGLEIVERLKNDTISVSEGNIQVTQSYKVTAFEDSLINIPSYPFVNGSDTVWSNALSLQMVQPYKIDTTKSKIRDIKPVFNASIYWWGIIREILLILLIIALLVAAYFVFRRYFKKKPLSDEHQKIFPNLPPHVVAINKLNKLKDEKPWQKNRSKEYHTLLTDILREYIERMFNISTMEMTSEEILEQLHFLTFEQKNAYASLTQVLRLADLVKFAKFEPATNDHELSLTNSYLFIDQTKVDTDLQKSSDDQKDKTENE